jgi:DNA-binding NarL/FixJ family response regulator
MLPNDGLLAGASMRRTCVAVYATDPITAAGVVSYLDRQGDFLVVPVGADARPDVVVCVTQRVTPPVLASVRRATAGRATPIVLVADDPHGGDVLGLVDSKVRAVLHRSAVTSDELAGAVRTAAAGGAVLPPDVLGALLHQVASLREAFLAPQGLTTSGLTMKEADVLRLIAEGWDGAWIADKLGYSERTITNIVHGLMSRLCLRNRWHAVAHAVRTGAI